MNECCDWHAVCLNDKEEYKGKSVYLSYCPECNMLSICDNGVVTRVEEIDREFYNEKYHEKINSIKSLLK